ncbi:MAG: LysR family transcriptional regulator [Clostridia bacterium]|nr:LysR family transcriptional regulator [Clostridia bacterium]
MSIKKYEAFAKTAELKSLTKAADALGYTQSGISHMLGSLEQELGFPLLLRSRSGVKLTSSGEKMLPEIVALLEKYRDVETLASSIAEGGTGEVRVGAFTSVAVNWLPGILKEYSKTHPNVEVKMLNGDYYDVEQWLSQGDIDVGFIALPAPVGINCVPLKEDALCVILPADHPLAALDSIPAEKAAKEPMISLLETSSQDIHRAFGEIKPDVRYITKDDYAIISMVQAGLGISIMPELLLKNHSSNIAVRPLVPAASRTLALGKSERAGTNPSAQSFIDCVSRWVEKNT